MHEPHLHFLTPDQRKQAIERIIDYYATERHENIGIIAAEDLLDVFLDIAGNEIFQRGVTEAQKKIAERDEQLRFELELLKNN